MLTIRLCSQADKIPVNAPGGTQVFPGLHDDW